MNNTKEETKDDKVDQQQMTLEERIEYLERETEELKEVLKKLTNKNKYRYKTDGDLIHELSGL